MSKPSKRIALHGFTLVEKEAYPTLFNYDRGPLANPATAHAIFNWNVSRL